MLGTISKDLFGRQKPKITRDKRVKRRNAIGTPKRRGLQSPKKRAFATPKRGLHPPDITIRRTPHQTVSAVPFRLLNLEQQNIVIRPTTPRKPQKLIVRLPIRITSPLLNRRFAEQQQDIKKISKYHKHLRDENTVVIDPQLGRGKRNRRAPTNPIIAR